MTLHADTIDARDLFNRLEELRDERKALQEELAEVEDIEPDAEVAECALAQWDEENGDELKALQAIENEISRDQTLIADSYFETYARDLAEESNCAEMTAWPFTCIDWAQAASELQHDFSCVEFDGVAYWTQS